jgi:hypothetical protein
MSDMAFTAESVSLLSLANNNNFSSLTRKGRNSIFSPDTGSVVVNFGTFTVGIFILSP